MNLYENLFFSSIIIIISFGVLIVVRRLYQLNISASKERLFFQDWNNFEEIYTRDSSLAVNYLIKKTNDILDRFSFFRAVLFLFFLVFTLLVALPIELITDYFQVAFNTSFSLMGIYFGYLSFRFTKSIKEIKLAQQNIITRFEEEQ